MTTKIIIKVELKADGVDSRAYATDGSPLIGKDGAGKDYHLGQISSNLEWAMHDMQNHFAAIFDEIYPDGWHLTFQL